jgi:hypothetical protein
MNIYAFIDLILHIQRDHNPNVSTPFRVVNDVSPLYNVATDEIIAVTFVGFDWGETTITKFHCRSNETLFDKCMEFLDSPID